jgi:hypothetical protein
MKKTNKKTNKIKNVLQSSTTKSVQIPLVGVLVFCFLLAASSFFAGAAWLKIKNSTNQTASATFKPDQLSNPEFDFYVMSFCPYGNQMETLLKPVAELLKNSITLQPHYIFEKITDLKIQCQQYDASNCTTYVAAGYFTSDSECKQELSAYQAECLDEKQYLKVGDVLYGSLHGRSEAIQDVREICAFNSVGEDKTNWWTFVDNVNQNCTTADVDTCWEEQAKQAGFDTNQITECFNTQATELIEKEVALTTENKVQGSPTLMINGASFPPDEAYTADNTGSLKIGKKVFTQDKYRTSDVIKEAICASFKRAPKVCKTTLEEPSNVASTTSDASCN